MDYFRQVECPSSKQTSKEYKALAERNMQYQIVNRVECPSCKAASRIHQEEKGRWHPVSLHNKWKMKWYYNVK